MSERINPGRNTVVELYKTTQEVLSSASPTGLIVLRNEVSQEIQALLQGKDVESIGIVERIATLGAKLNELCTLCLSSGPLRDAIVDDPSAFETLGKLEVAIEKDRQFFCGKMETIIGEMADGGSSFREVESDVLDAAELMGEYSAKAKRVLTLLALYCPWVFEESKE